MADDTPKPDRRSFSFIRADDLPGDWGTFTKDADRARKALETAHNAQIVPPNARPAQRAEGQLPARFQHRANLPDPRPSYAIPAPRRRDEEWYQSASAEPEQQPLSREEFQRLRSLQTTQKNRHRSRG